MTQAQTSTTGIMTESVERDKHMIAGVIERYRRGFATMDPVLLKGIWDEAYDNPVYIAQEMAQPVYGQAGISAYYDQVVGVPGWKSTMEISDPEIGILGEAAWAICHFRFEGEAEGTRHTAVGRNTFLLHRVDDAWKVIHYHESRPGEL